jgi:hypothetical protein
LNAGHGIQRNLEVFLYAQYNSGAVFRPVWLRSADDLTLVSPVTTKAQRSNGDEKMGQQSTTITGKVTSVEKNWLTVKLGTDANVANSPYKKFQMNKSTKVHGDLKVGSNVQVTYRPVSTSDLAVIVKVTS